MYKTFYLKIFQITRIKVGSSITNFIFLKIFHVNKIGLIIVLINFQFEKQVNDFISKLRFGIL